MKPKEKVLAKYPKAHCSDRMIRNYWRVFDTNEQHCFWTQLGQGSSPGKAWERAAKKIKK